MIPQRNLSVLAKDGGRRIPESVLDDYCLAWFLEELTVADLRATLGFKGGTALKRCYFGDYRFSEDLDFTLIAQVPPDELKARLEPVYASVREASGIVFGFDREDRQMHDNSYTFYLRYEGPLPRASSAKVDITLHEKIVYPLPERAVLRGYEEFADLPKTGFCLSIRWRKSPPRKPPRSRMRCGRSLHSARSHAKAWPRPSAPRKPG